MYKCGIWIDKEKAHIMLLKEALTFETVTSDLNELIALNLSKGGASEIIKDRRVLERHKNFKKQYFKNIAQQLTDANQLLIFGPAEIGHEFVKALQQENPALGNKVVAVKKAHKMTENQLKAYVKDFFGSNS